MPLTGRDGSTPFSRIEILRARTSARRIIVGPAIVSLADPQSAASIAEATLEVGRRWPQANAPLAGRLILEVAKLRVATQVRL